jgi:hypothetical protein
MDFDTRQAFALIMVELKEMRTEIRQELSEIKTTMATKDQVAMVMEAVNTTNKNLSGKMENLSAKDKELENVARGNAYNIALLQGKAQ